MQYDWLVYSLGFLSLSHLHTAITMETVEPHINSNGIWQWDSIVLIRQSISYIKKEESEGEGEGEVE